MLRLISVSTTTTTTVTTTTTITIKMRGNTDQWAESKMAVWLYFFNCISRELKKDALEKGIRKETFEQFSMRVKKTILENPAAKIDKTIETRDKRIEMVMKAKGMRIKY